MGRSIKTILFLIAISLLSACSLEVAITQPQTQIDPGLQQSPGAEFHHAEIVTTSNGAVIRGAFGEISENQVLSNGVVIEGSFY